MSWIAPYVYIHVDIRIAEEEPEEEPELDLSCTLQLANFFFLDRTLHKLCRTRNTRAEINMLRIQYRTLPTYCLLFAIARSTCMWSQHETLVLK